MADEYDDQQGDDVVEGTENEDDGPDTKDNEEDLGAHGFRIEGEDAERELDI